MEGNEKKIQKILNKLIAEEMVACEFYVGCVIATKHDVSKQYSKLFFEIAEDERDDHAKHLIEWARENDFKVPFRFKDYEKHADERAVKLLNALKEDQKAKYYVEKAIESEKLALESYEEALKEEMPYSLEQILVQNMYDEMDHYEKLEILLAALEAGVDLV